MRQVNLLSLVTALAVAASLISVLAFVPNKSIFLSNHGGTGGHLMVETIEDDSFDATDRMTKSVDSVLKNLNTIRTGRASPAILDLVRADYYGVETPINQMATISVPSAQQLTVDPFDKSTLGEIEKAIMEADIGLTPQNDGSLIRLNIPALTEDRRREMMKQCRAIGEDGKVAVRNVRRKTVDTIKKIEKNGDLSEDESKSRQEKIQKLTDAKIKEIESIVGKKEKEVETV